MNKIHFHTWKEIKLFNPKNNNSLVLPIYRYCKCGEWQKSIISDGNTWWEICEKPSNIENEEEYNVGE